MSIYWCTGCNQYKDADTDGIVEDPNGHEICESCWEDLLAFADYNPQDFE